MDDSSKAAELVEDVEEIKYGVAVGSPILSVTTVGFTAIYPPNSMGGTYATLPGNQPSSYNNFVAIWATTQIPWTAPALVPPAPIPNNYQGADFTISSLSLANISYIIGYSVGPPSAPNWTSICASAVVNQGGSAGATDNVSMSINNIGTTSLAVNYHTLAGYQPTASQNWIGLWAGQVSPYSAPPPMSTVYVPSTNEGVAVMNSGVFISPNVTYTLIYFMGGALISSTITSNALAAAILQFTTTSSLEAVSLAGYQPAFEFHSTKSK